MLYTHRERGKLTMDNMLGNALAEMVGPFMDFVEKLGGPEGAQWLAAFKRFLRKENAWPTSPIIWKTITIGGMHKTVGELHAALISNGFCISDGASDILKRITLVSKQTTLDLVVVTVTDLGFKDGAMRKDIYERAQELGLALCPAEVGPQLRLQYKDQPNGKWFHIAMEPIIDSVGNLRVFRVEHVGSALWLLVYFGNPDLFWLGSSRWVFVCPRK